MPTFYSNIVTPREAIPAQTTDSEYNGQTVRSLAFTAAVPSGATAGDRIDLAELPAGAIVVGGLIHNSAITGVTAARLRTESSATAFQAADVSLASAAVHTIDSPAKGLLYRAVRFALSALVPGGLRYGKERVYYSLVTGTAAVSGTISGVIHFTA